MANLAITEFDPGHVIMPMRQEALAMRAPEDVRVVRGVGAVASVGSSTPDLTPADTGEFWG